MHQRLTFSIKSKHDDFPTLLADAADLLASTEWNVPDAAQLLACTSSQLPEVSPT
ncbi:MAG: hypothetical protein R3B91_13735 [Planctomycetaceae bacterium]